MNIPTRKKTIENVKSRGKHIAAVFPIHYPREIFRAFDVHPVEVWGPPLIDTSPASAHLQTYICSVVKSGLSFYLNGGLDVADVILVPHCCDSLQGLGSILTEFVRRDVPTLTLYIPRGNRKSDIEFLAEELKKLSGELASIFGFMPSKNEFIRAIEEEEAIDRLKLKAYEVHRRYATESGEFYRMMRAGEYLPLAVFEYLLNEFISYVHTKRDGVRLILSGVLPEPMEVLEFIERSGGVVIDDDFACLKRRVYPEGGADDPFERMAERIVNGYPDPMRGSPISEREKFLVGMAEKSMAAGVVFYNVKFCEPEEFYHPILRERLRKAGIGTLNVEIDISEQLEGRVKTRIAAFIESLKGVG